MLTIHVLDTTKGTPAKGVHIELYMVVNNHRLLIKKANTNCNGRCDQPLLSGDQIRIGTYELDFLVNDYFNVNNPTLKEPPFLSTITIRFGVSETNKHYHIPLLVSPYSYSTYRGS